MPTDTRPDHLEEFFRRVGPRPDGGASRPVITPAHPAPDLFAAIAAALDDPQPADTPTSPAPASGARSVRREWDDWAASHGPQDIPGGETTRAAKPHAPGRRPVTVRGLIRSSTLIIILCGLLFAVVTGVSNLHGMWARHSAGEAALAQRQEDFTRAGWRRSEQVSEQKGLYDTTPTRTYTSYVKEMSPDEGRVHMLVTEQGGVTTHEVTGWTRTESARAQALAELASLFPLHPDAIDTVDVRVHPGGGRLSADETRAVRAYPEFADGPYGTDGRPVPRIEYGESGFRPVDGEGTNIVGGLPPADGRPYYYVIGGSGTYWRSPRQRDLLLQTAFERLRDAPDGGRGARAILLVYYTGASGPEVETINIDRGPAAAPPDAGDPKGKN